MRAFASYGTQAFLSRCTTLHHFHNFENSHHYIQIEFEVKDIFAKSGCTQGLFLYQKKID
jgi:hypothetical protein